MAKKKSIFVPKIFVVPAVKKPFRVGRELVPYNYGLRYVSPVFTQEFGELIIEPRASYEIEQYELAVGASDRQIAKALDSSGRYHYATDPVALAAMLALQSQGERGWLSLDHWNLFHARAKNGKWFAVSVHWNDDGWGLYADALGDPNDRSDGCWVFSRKFERSAARKLKH